MFKTVEDVQKFCKKNDIKMIDFKMVDLIGRWKHLTMPVERFDDDTMEYGIGFDGSNYGYAPVEKSDMVFIPDISTATVDPFVSVPTLSMIGDVKVIENPDNKPFDQYPRNVAMSALEYMKGTGVADEMIIGPEFEFHIFDHVTFENRPEGNFYKIDSPEGWWNTGIENGRNTGYNIEKDKGYHADYPLDITYDIRSKMCNLLTDWGIDVKYHHHEVGGPGQVEIEVELGDMLRMADATMITKYIIKNQAVAEGLTATFMPKPLYNEAGNGMHVHMLLKKDGKPVFYDKNGYSGLSKTAHYFIGGILKHAASVCAFTNPSTNSFKRLVPGFEAPVTIGYATANRSAVIRIPAYAKSPEAKRFELRNPDGTCNPYYAYAAILMAGLDGIKNKIDPSVQGWGPYDFNLFNLSDEEKAKIKALPRTLDEALNALEEDYDYLTKGGVFPEPLIKQWIRIKRTESDEITQVPSAAEYQKYYNL